MSVDYTKFKLPLDSQHKAFDDPITPLLGDPIFMLSTAKQFVAIGSYYCPSSELKLAKKNIALVKSFIATIKWGQRLHKDIPWVIEQIRLLPTTIPSLYTHMTSTSSNSKKRNYQATLKKGAKITATSIKSCKKFLAFLKNLKKFEIVNLGVKFSISTTILSTADLVSKLLKMEKIIIKLNKAKTEQAKYIATKNAIIFLSRTIFSFIKFVASLYMIKLSVGVLLIERTLFYLASTSQRIDKNTLALQKKKS